RSWRATGSGPAGSCRSSATTRASGRGTCACAWASSCRAAACTATSPCASCWRTGPRSTPPPATSTRSWRSPGSRSRRTRAPGDLGVAATYRVAWRDPATGELEARQTDDPTALLHQLTSAALARGEPLAELSVTRPSLEDVYLDLTSEEEEAARA